MENEELQGLMEGFEAVWQRVSPSAEETPAPQRPPTVIVAEVRREPCSQRVPRWFGTV